MSQRAIHPLTVSTYSTVIFSLKLVFSFADKLFNLVVKEIEAMDASILKGERQAGGSKKKVTPSSPNASKHNFIEGSFPTHSYFE